MPNNSAVSEEIWKDVPSWQGLYQASSFGNIRSVKNYREVLGKWGPYTRSYGGQLLSPKVGRGDYLYVNLWNANKGHMRAVHRLVCEAFTRNLPNLDCNHLDSNRQNNNILNLEWCTRKENLHHAENNGRLMCWEINRRRAADRRKSLQVSH